MRPLTTVLIALSGASGALSAAPAVLVAQAAALDAKLASAPSGTIRLTYTVRAGVCGNGNSVSTHDGHTRDWESRNSDIEWDTECDHGPVHLVIRTRDYEATAIRAYVGGQWRAPHSTDAPVTDWGAIPASNAAAWLLSLARRLPSAPGRDAIFPATLADSAIVWPALITLARDTNVPTSTREQAVFWLGQAAGNATAGLDSLARDTSVDEEVRGQAVFALSQRPANEGIPALIQIAKANRDPALRRKALFWLGQSQDPRAIDLFEEILTDHH